MKKFYLLLFLLISAGFSSAQTCTITITTFPYFQDFEASAGDWTTSGTSSSWAHGTPAGTIINTAGSGTKSWVTNLTGPYNNNEQSFVVGPCFNFSSLAAPIISLKIWWNMENNFDKAALQSSIDGGTTWQHVGAFGDPNNWYNNNSTSGPGVGGGVKVGWSGRASSSNGSGGWVTARHALDGLGGQASVRLRIAFGTDGSGVDDGFAFDDISIMNAPANDVAIIAITSPAVSGCGFTATSDVCITIRNLGSVATTTIPVSYQIGTGTPVTETAALVIAPGATGNYCFTTKANLSVAGTYNFTITTALAGDADPSNNTMTRVVTAVPNISTFPYFQDFEASAGGWTTSGTASSWAYGTPAGTVINSAGSGTKSWITNLAGPYNNNEQSFVVGPCFNFSSLAAPIISMKIWWNMENNFDKAALQSSIDGGTTWQHVGAFGDPNNWYNNNSTSGPGVGGGVKEGWSGRASSSNGSNGWVTARRALTGLGGQSSVLLRIAFGSDGSGVDDGFAFDDISIINAPANDVAITAITSPAASGCGFTATSDVCITIRNFGSVATTTIPVSYQIGTGTPVTETANLVIAPGATGNYCFTTKANLSVAGTYNFTITTALVGDADPSNNTMTKVVTAVPNVSTFPYSQNFENGAGGWTTGGTSSSWALGTPAGTVINSAASGTNAWVTNLTGPYNNNEQSFVQGPCFNFAGIPDPDFEMKIWWNMENNFDKAALQSSIDGGVTWQHVGAFGDPHNWYNNNSTSGPGVGGGVKVGWSGRASSSNGSGGWLLAKHKLNGLGGQSSVLLRIAFGTDGSGVDDGFAFDDVRIGDNTGNLSINSFVPLTKICGFTSSEKVEVVLENLGSVAAAAGSYTMEYRLNNAPTWVSQPGIALAPGVATNFIFTTSANLSAPGAHSIEVRLVSTTDPDLTNNQITYNVSNATIPSIPVVLDFETPTSGIGSLRVITRSRATVTEATGGANTGTKGMIMDGIDHTGWVTPVGVIDPWTNNLDHFSAAYICFDPSAGPAMDSMFIIFDLKQLFKTANANTNFRVTVNGQQVGPTYRPPFDPTNPATPIAWRRIRVDLTAYKNSTGIQIGLESSVKEGYQNGNGTANLIDNVIISRRTTGLKSDILASQIKVHPNPSNGIFNVSAPKGNYTIEVTDMTGRTILKQTANGTATVLNLKDAAKGIYLMTIISEGSIAAKRLVVE